MSGEKAGERDRTFLLPDDCDCLPPYADCTHGPAEVEGECGSCGESPEDECPKSKRPCGHHCNHVWTHDACDWCGKEFAPTPVPSEVAETTAGEREVEAAARAIHAKQEYSTCWDDDQAGAKSRMGTPMRPLGENGREFYRGLAEAALSADVLAALLDRVRREEGAKVLREAADALNREGLSFKEGGWGSNPADQQTSAVMVKALTWLRARAASVGRGDA